MHRTEANAAGAEVHNGGQCTLGSACMWSPPNIFSVSQETCDQKQVIDPNHFPHCQFATPDS